MAFHGMQFDHWTRGALAMFVAICVGAMGFGNSGIMLFSLGGALYSLGEWINHPNHTRIQQGRWAFEVWRISGYQRKNSFTGILFVTAGITISLYGGQLVYLDTHPHQQNKTETAGPQPARQPQLSKPENQTH